MTFSGRKAGLVQESAVMACCDSSSRSRTGERCRGML